MPKIKRTAGLAPALGIAAVLICGVIAVFHFRTKPRPPEPTPESRVVAPVRENFPKPRISAIASEIEISLLEVRTSSGLPADAGEASRALKTGSEAGVFDLEQMRRDGARALEGTVEPPAFSRPVPPPLPVTQVLPEFEIPKKMELGPIPEPELPGSDREKRIAELEKEIADEPSTYARERLLLTLAGGYVGENRWEDAGKIYRQLAAESTDEDVLTAVRRNFQVVDKQFEVSAATDPALHQTIELELAEIHLDLGHRRACKRICDKALEQNPDSATRERALNLLQRVREMDKLLVEP